MGKQGGRRTQVLGGAGDLAEQLDKVGQVVAQELGLEDEVLAGVVGAQGGAQQLRLADDAQGGAALGGLRCKCTSVELPLQGADCRGGGGGDVMRTRKAKLARPSVRPGSGWKRVPAFATRASVVVGPAKSLLACLTPAASPDWYWKLPEAGAARPRRWGWRAACWRAARCAPRQAVERVYMVKRAPGGGWAMRWRAAMDGGEMACRERSRCSHD